MEYAQEANLDAASFLDLAQLAITRDLLDASAF